MSKEFDYSNLDNYDLNRELISLENGMKTFTDEKKKVYSESWNQRLRKHKALLSEIGIRDN
jgi:hypothetical protein